MGAMSESWLWSQSGFVADVARACLEGTTRRDGLGGARAERAMISPPKALSSRGHDLHITITAHFMHISQYIASPLSHQQVKDIRVDNNIHCCTSLTQARTGTGATYHGKLRPQS